MPLQLTYPVWAALRREGNSAIRKEWIAAGLDKSPAEVPCIKNLIQKGMPQLENAWQPILKSHHIKMAIAGAVCHPIPQVTYKSSGRACELGDLLIVHDHFPDGGGQERRACIMQAKMFGPNGVTSKNDTQKTLYQKWDDFTYVKWPGGLSELQDALDKNAGIAKGSPGSLTRTIGRTLPYGRVATAAEIDEGCRYAMIDVVKAGWNFPFKSNPWRICSANVGNLYKHQRGPSLSEYLLRILSGDAGRNVPQLSWPKNLNSACHWSLMIHELMHALPLYGSSLNPPAASTAFLIGGPEKIAPEADAEEPEREFGIISVVTSGGSASPSRAERFRDD